MFKIASNTEQFTLNVDGDLRLRVVRFQGREGISQLFTYQIDLAHNEELSFDQVVGKLATLKIEIGEVPRVVHGLISRLEQIDQTTNLGIYRATMVPDVWRLLHRMDCRMFQEKTAPKIIEEVLKAANISSDHFMMSLEGTHPAREYCVQYRESDWAFISRLMEEEGIFYYFEHHDGEHLLVISDVASTHSKITGDPNVVFRPLSGQVAESEHIISFRSSRDIRPGKVTLTDFNFIRPAMDLKADHEAEKYPDLELYDYPGVYQDQGPGRALAKIRLEEQQALVDASNGESACSRLTPGSIFSLTEHPRGDNNGDYLLVEIEQQGSQPQVLELDAGDMSSEYSNRFLCIPASVPFRPARRTHRPVVRGVQTAIVTGPSGEEVHTDEHGRVKVQFHWDRVGARDDKSSCWIRVSQLWAGQGWGAMWIPRIGHEVIVDFLEGDPDRPIITGRVYHGGNPVPYDLPADKTKSTIKSNSSPGGNGSNELRFEDAAGSEEIYLHGQKDWNIVIENDKTQNIGHDETLDVKNDQTITIGHNRDKEVVANQTEKIGVNKSIEVGANHSETIGANMSLTVTANKTETVIVNSAETVGVAKELTVGGAYQVTVGAAMNETVARNQTITVGGTRTETVTGPASTKAKKILIEAAEEIVLRTGDAKIIMKKNGDITIDAGGALKVVSKKDTSVNATGKMILKGQKISQN